MATRLELFRGIAADLGELFTVRATQASTDLRQFVSADQLTIPTSALNGRDVWYSEATAASQANRQTARRVVANSASTTSLTVDADWPALPQAGDVIDLVNFHGYSARYYEIHNKINALIERVSDELAAEVAGESEDFNFLTPYLSYDPEEWDWILGAQWQDYNEVWHPIFKRDLEFQPWDNKVVIKGRPRRMLTGYPVRLIGGMNRTPLDDDDDEIPISAAWIRMQAAAELKREAAGRRGDAPTDLTVSNMLLADAKEMRAQATQQFHAKGGFRWSTH